MSEPLVEQAQPPTGEPQPVVTIVMRTKDRPLLLRRAVADVCAQTFTHWHLVVVDDGGDGVEARRLAAEVPGLEGRVTVLHNERSRGMEAASNQAIKGSDSTFIAIHDDDDTWHPAFLARTVAHLEETDEAAVAVRTEIVWERIEGEQIVEEGREPFWPQIRWFGLFDLLRTNRTVPISVLHRRDAHDEVGMYREDLTVVGDWEFNLRLALGRRPLGFIDGEPLAFWHRRRSAEGPLANSVHDRKDDHERLTMQVREEALREHVGSHGIGGLLYLTGYAQREIDLVHERITYGEERLHEAIALLRRAEELAVAHGEVLARQGELLARQEQLLGHQTQRFDQLDRRIDDLERAVSDASLVSLLRRRYRRLKTRLTG